ncbi:di/tricarboxylate transporter [Natronospira proteinivora]|uniref:Di/tricarboxylate transporter n=1 Tax=Natronospira proteinivora TaxID=1807133 RepID=A0ABT1GAA8_9GAMM|nr:SLC13 family permease [Natronospira proteinivora]MCP1728206.1 di/tricarboxylate transporter [Natronospira proteinivora]
MPAHQQILLLLLATLLLFAWGRWRYDLVAGMALLAAVLLDLVPSEEAFNGFAHPAVITVAAVLVISRALGSAGVVDLIAGQVTRIGDRVLIQTFALTLVVAVCSAFMNNVGALALMLPVAIQVAREHGFPVSRLLMPLAFGSLLGGLTTLIGTPPNIIIATYRQTELGEAFAMFDFASVGLLVMAAGIVLVTILPRWVLPDRKGESSPDELFEIENYLLELTVEDDAKVIDDPIRALAEPLEKVDYTVVGIARGKRIISPVRPHERIRAGDILLVEADPEELQGPAEKLGLSLGGSGELDPEHFKNDELTVMEAVVLPEAFIEGHTLRTLHLPARYGITLLAVARQGERLRERLGKIRFQSGDVLLLQGEREALQEATSRLGCLPLADRELSVGAPRKLITGLGLFALALGLIVSGLLPVQIALPGAALGMVLSNVLSLRQAYGAIDWPVIVLLGAMLPVGMAFETSGAAGLLASGLLQISGEWPPAVTLGLLLLAAMLLSDVINNAAAAVLLAPVALAIATALGVSPDPFLMAVAVGASCAFLTPIGHQSNTLVMGPAGYRFTDFARLGLPLSLLVFALGLPMILLIWPF